MSTPKTRDWVVELYAEKRKNRELREKLSKVLFENRALRVQQYAQRKYAEAYAAGVRSAKSAGQS